LQSGAARGQQVVVDGADRLQQGGQVLVSAGRKVTGATQQGQKP
jgi:hypothetical protein